jgi:hypothetical protein
MQLPPTPTASVPTPDSTPKPKEPGPAIINNNDDVPPPPCQAWTRAQHQSSHVHLINSAITKALMPLIDLKPAASFPAHRYIAALQALLENTYGVIHKANPPVTANSVNFIGAIIDDVTGNVLKYCHLIKSNPSKPFSNTASQTNLVACFKEYATSTALTHVFSIADNKCPITNEQRMVRSVATIVPKRINHIALNSPLVGTESRTTATKAPPPQHSSLPNSSLTQWFQHQRQNAMEWTYQTSTSWLPWKNMNTCNSNSNSSPTKSSVNATKKISSMNKVGCTSKSEWVCTAFPSPASLPTNYSNNNSM